jgi:AcrR family transcriptional regulator
MNGKDKRIYGGREARLWKEDRRNRLIRAGFESFGTEGYVKTTIKTICSLSGLTERYFYESFESKEELLIAVYRQLTDEMVRDSVTILENGSLSALESSGQSLTAFYRYFREDPRRAQIRFFEILGVSRAVDEEYHAATGLLVEILKRYLIMAFPGLTRERLDRSKAPIGLAGAMVMICAEWVLDGYKTPIEDIVRESMDFFLVLGRHLQAD